MMKYSFISNYPASVIFFFNVVFQKIKQEMNQFVMFFFFEDEKTNFDYLLILKMMIKWIYYRGYYKDLFLCRPVNDAWLLLQWKEVEY